MASIPFFPRRSRGPQGHLDWLTHFVKKNESVMKRTKHAEKEAESEEALGPIQQGDYLKDFLMEIVNNGLEAAYAIYEDNPPGPGVDETSPSLAMDTSSVAYDADVIIVGAGMAGLGAAYELMRAGLSVKVLEQTKRIGGRVYTYDSSNSNLAPGLYGEAGAMRLPCANEDVGSENRYQDVTHFLTDFYITKLKVPTAKFANSDDNTFTNIYGLYAKANEWEAKYFNQVWPDWKKNIKGNFLKKDPLTQNPLINTIDDYYNATTEVVTRQLRTWLARCNDPADKTITWDRWINIWSQFTLEDLFECSLQGIFQKIPNIQDQEGLGDLNDLLPWTDDAIRGYSTLSYTEQLDQSLVQYLRDQLGQWWSANMHRITGGMIKLPNALVDTPVETKSGTQNLKDHILLEHTVNKIQYSYDEDHAESDFVTVSCYPIDESSNPVLQQGPQFTARAVIVTTPVNILRQITFEYKGIEPPPTDVILMKPPIKFYQAIEDIFSAPSTKILIQTKSRFWESNHGIKGGFSKTNLPIGQLHYVSPEIPSTTDKGLLLVYTWKNEALLFGSMKQEDAVREVLEQISIIHPDINDHYDGVGIVHSWYNQPQAQGAYGLLKPKQFDNIKYLWYPMDNVHFAGETFSFTTGWIQGALESGLKAAYYIYMRRQKAVKN